MGAFLGEDRGRRRHQRDGRAGERADADGADLVRSDRADLLVGGGQLVQQRGAAVGEDAASLSEGQAAARSDEQRAADLPFQCAHLLADRRLRAVRSRAAARNDPVLETVANTSSWRVSSRSTLYAGSAAHIRVSVQRVVHGNRYRQLELDRRSGPSGRMEPDSDHRSIDLTISS